jgi:hypothetical protein
MKLLGFVPIFSTVLLVHLDDSGNVITKVVTRKKAVVRILPNSQLLTFDYLFIILHFFTAGCICVRFSNFWWFVRVQGEGLFLVLQLLL